MTNEQATTTRFTIELDAIPPGQAEARFPVPLTPLIGRDQELAQVISLVRDTDARLITIAGPGGVGKTRLGMAAANQVLTEFPGGARLFNGGGIDSADRVLPLLIETLRRQFGSQATDLRALAADIGATRVLLVIDAWEHVIEARHDVVALLEQLPPLTLLVTSRIVLDVRGEHVIGLRPFQVPESTRPFEDLVANHAVKLFAQRAHAIRPPFELTPANVGQVCDICRRLEGIPLAIELAAARTRLYSVAAIRERLDNVLDVLVGGPLDLPERMRSMRAAIRTSFDALSPHARTMLRAASAFDAPFLIAALDALTEHDPDAPSSVEIVTELVNHSLIDVNPDETGATRGRILEPIRAYAREQLEASGEANLVHEHLLRYYEQMIEPRHPHLFGPRQQDVMRFLDVEASNIAGAIRAAIGAACCTESALRVTILMCRYWTLRGKYALGVEVLEALLPLADEVPFSVRMSALRSLGTMYVELSQPLRAQECYEQTLAIAESDGTRDDIADALNNLAVICMRSNEYDEAEVHLQRSLELRRDGGDRQSLPATLSNLGDIALSRGDLAGAHRFHEEAYQVRLSIGNAWGMVISAKPLMQIALLQKNYADADQWYSIGRARAEEVGNQFGCAELDLVHASVSLGKQDRRAALDDIRGAISRLRTMESSRIVSESVGTLARLLVAIGAGQLAAQVVGNYIRLMQMSLQALPERGIVNPTMIADVATLIGDGDMRRNVVVGTHQTLDAMYDAIDTALVADLAPAEPPAAAHPDPDEPLPNPLTKRETQVLALVAQGLSDKSIATELGISPRTAMTHVSNIMTKLAVHTRSAASMAAVRMGVIDDPGAISFPDDER